MKCDVCDEKITSCDKCGNNFVDGDSLNCGGFDEGHICSTCVGSEGSATK